jgi:hypothetical protein
MPSCRPLPTGLTTVRGIPRRIAKDRRSSARPATRREYANPVIRCGPTCSSRRPSAARLLHATRCATLVMAGGLPPGLTPTLERQRAGLEVDPRPSMRWRSVPFSLVRSGGSSSQCGLVLPCGAVGNDQRNDQTYAAGHPPSRRRRSPDGWSEVVTPSLGAAPFRAGPPHSTAGLSPNSSSSNSWRISISPSASGSPPASNGSRLAHSMASSIDCTWRIQ